MVDTALQFFAVVVNQLTGQDNKPLFPRLIAAVQYLGELAGEAGAGGIGELTGGVIDNTGFGGVGNHIFQFLGFCQRHHGIKIRFAVRGIEAPGNRGDDPLAVNLHAAQIAPEIQGVEPLLLIEQFNLGFAPVGPAGLYQDALAVPAGFFVGNVKPIVYKCTQEIPLSELQHLFWRVFQKVSRIAVFL